MNVELNRSLSRWIAGIIAAGLISQGAVYGEVPGTGSVSCGQPGLYIKVAGIDAQFLRGVEREKICLCPEDT